MTGRVDAGHFAVVCRMIRDRGRAPKISSTPSRRIIHFRSSEQIWMIVKPKD